MPIDYVTGFAPGLGIATEYGITASYFKIAQLYVDYTTNTGFAKYFGYESVTGAFATGSSPLITVEMRLDPADVTGIYGISNTQSNLSVTGASVIDFFDDVISSGTKGTTLQSKTKVNYPADAYPCEECGGGF